MAFEIPGFQRSWIAGGTAGTPNSDLSVSATIGGNVRTNGYQYLFVKFAAGLLVPVAAATDNVVGVLQNKPAPGQAATVMVSGVTRVSSTDAGIIVGSVVYVDQYGYVKSTGTANQAVGIAEEASANATGFTIAVCLKPFGALH